MHARIFGFLAETSVHVGSSRSEGVVDLPVAREAVTGYPYVPGSGLKGALRQYVEDDVDKNVLFGAHDSTSAGQLLIGDARLLLLPVRSLNAAAMWVTCPHLIERYSRDSNLAGANFDASLPKIDKRDTYLGPKYGNNLPLMLEERALEHGGELDPALIEQLAKHISGVGAVSATIERLKVRTVLLHDDDFAWFAKNAVPVSARNNLDETTKISKNLWYEEALPPDTVFYSLIGDRRGDGLAKLETVFRTRPYLQLGGNETVGMGWVRVCIPASSGSTHNANA
ncbi:MAG: type III-B CRISPR module RAMP protein Cmr4 [Candidatus Baltobacteraceae bacterium]